MKSSSRYKFPRSRLGLSIRFRLYSISFFSVSFLSGFVCIPFRSFLFPFHPVLFLFHFVLFCFCFCFILFRFYSRLFCLYFRRVSLYPLSSMFSLFSTSALFFFIFSLPILFLRQCGMQYLQTVLSTRAFIYFYIFENLENESRKEGTQKYQRMKEQPEG